MTEPARPLEALIAEKIAEWRANAAKPMRLDMSLAAYPATLQLCADELAALLQAAAPPAPTAEPTILLSDALALCQQWIDAYPLGVFPADGESKDCHAAAMGRHMAKCLIEDFQKFAAPPERVSEGNAGLADIQPSRCDGESTSGPAVEPREEPTHE
jgi:hypothetical protein